jgi:hypothetical protein
MADDKTFDVSGGPGWVAATQGGYRVTYWPDTNDIHVEARTSTMEWTDETNIPKAAYDQLLRLCKHVHNQVNPECVIPTPGELRAIVDGVISAQHSRYLDECGEKLRQAAKGLKRECVLWASYASSLEVLTRALQTQKLDHEIQPAAGSPGAWRVTVRW